MIQQDIQAADIPAQDSVMAEAAEIEPAPAELENDTPETATQQESATDRMVKVLARLDALESQLATLSRESSPTPTSEAERREKAPPERARQMRIIKRYLAIRKERERLKCIADAHREMRNAVQGELRATSEKLQRMTEKRARAVLNARRYSWKLRTQALYSEINFARSDDKRRNSAMRARRMIDAARQDAKGKAQALQVSRDELNRLKRNLKDPSQPERASDVARLIKERDQARNANAALEARCDRLQATVNQGSDIIESMGTRLANAEAAVRRLAAS
ncbi:hypothetical protein GRI39_01875 [Altererythrobacter indicus]|uniref:Uncharacterized protein n=1 Tax=Altericroceibacterium indicum TaxID=374177 RepID=A0A845A4Y5_9SPHN|nr:hypothetical protein [Altericroceibacterium indicum]MXP24794.1 hypothetical protein [Altericroceibacterium indicum]